MTDRFRSYNDLAAVYVRGRHYNVSVSTGSTQPNVLIMAPHGGKIEIRTMEIAQATAAHDYSCYVFEADLPANNREEMHIASEYYDVPEALGAVKTAAVVIALHGREDGDDSKATWMGGLDSTLSKHIGEALDRSGFPVLFDPPKFGGKHPNNICNRGLTKAGVQLEIPLSLRREFQRDLAREYAFVSCLRTAITSYHTPGG